MQIDILTLFPGYFETPLKESMIKRALDKNLVSIKVHGLREFAEDKHQRVDDRPFGGGAGMVLKPEPLLKGIRHLKQENTYVVLLSARGKLLNAKRCRSLAQKGHVLLITGHYEGVDERVLDEVDEEISIGDYILTNGAPAAMVVVDSVVRLIPGVLGNALGTIHESFEQGLLEHAQYTRPAYFEGKKVPDILLGGNASKIVAWQSEDAVEKTKCNREDLYFAYMAQGDGDFSLVLGVQTLAASVKFYKAIGFTLEKREETRAFLRFQDLGIVLVVGRGQIDGASMYRLSVDSRLFLRTQTRLQKVGLLEGSDGQKVFFRDIDGHRWVIFDSEKERKNGKESFSRESGEGTIDK